MKRRAINLSEEGYNCAMDLCEVQLVERSSCLPVQIRKAAEKKSSTDLVELATEIQKADSFIGVTACSKLQTILEQVRYLQDQAANVLREASTNAKLHHAACNFKKIPGKTYHLYRKSSQGQIYFSMLSPEEWGCSLTDEFLGSFRLEPDMSWTPSDKIIEKDNGMVLVNKIMNAHALPGFKVNTDQDMMIEM